MKKSSTNRLLALALVIVLVAALIPALALIPGAETVTYTLDAGELADVAQGSKSDGESEKVGTDNFFTIFYSASTRVEANSKTFEDGFVATKRLNWGGSAKVTDPVKNAISFSTDAAATVKVWWVSGGDGRQLGLYTGGGTLVEETTESVKNALYITNMQIAEGGSYLLASPGGSNNIYKVEISVEVTTEKTYELNTSEMTEFAAGAKADGESEKAGTDNFFTLIYSASTKVEANSKTFEDGFVSTKRLTWGGSAKVTGTVKNAISFSTDGAATIKVWWVSGGDGRQLGLYTGDGTLVKETTESVKNSLYITTMQIAEGGSYLLASPGGSNYIFKVAVTTGASAEKPPRADWSGVEAPVITSAADNGTGKILLTVSANIGYDGADYVELTMKDASGNVVATKKSSAEKAEHSFEFTPGFSGTYTFSATLVREGEESKTSLEATEAIFVLPLTVPVMVSATSKGEGKVEIVYSPVKEATAYIIYVDGERVGNTDETTYTISDLTVGTKYSISVSAQRGAEPETARSSALEVTATAEAQTTWGFVYYGPSTNSADNGYVGNLNEDGKVTVYSENGKGKIVPASVDGLAFYYTAVPVTHNFTLRATVTVDSWTYSNGQEGFGLIATDRLGTSGDTSNFWNNSYMAVASKIEYRYDEDNEKIYDINGSGIKYTMKLGLGTIVKTGVTPENLSKFESADSNFINANFNSSSVTLEDGAAYYGKEEGSYNVIGNYTGQGPGGDIELSMLTSFTLEIQKNNTGYFITYYDENGEIIKQQKYYGPDDLSQLDKDNVYVGFFASRNARATFSDVTFTTIPASEDKPAEERPIEKIPTVVTAASSEVSTSANYELLVDANINGTLKVYLNNQLVIDETQVTVATVGKVVRTRFDLTFANYGKNTIKVEFTPDLNQELPPYTALESTEKAFVVLEVVYNKGSYHETTIYVAPGKDTPGYNGPVGLPNNAGTPEYPLDIYTAIDNAVPGQTIVLMEGTYKLKQTVKIKRGIDGTLENPIRMIADPAATTRPVLDFCGEVAGIVHGGNYWYFYGFDVTNTQNYQKGFQVSGNYNTLDNIHTYHNGNTGIQISRYSGNDQYEDWPAYNLILNCTSYGNADAGYEDADGFAAKLTIGDGNVFDGCVAYNNADDGWDLYAKVQSGPIGSVVIKNCVAYLNGYLEDGTVAGNGNGFKMGGESLSGKHQLINSFAFFNKAKGIDSNSCPDIIVENCVSYNNGSYNVAFYTNNAANTDFFAIGIVSFKDNTAESVFGGLGYLAIGEQLKPKGTQDQTKYTGNSNYYWDGSVSKNGAGENITSDMFESLTFTGITRNADGTINMNGFLILTDNAPDGTGAVDGNGGTSDAPELETPEVEHDPAETWTNTDTMYHWHECECGFRADMTPHTFEWVIDSEPTEFKNGKKHEECTECGYKKPAITTYYQAPQTPPADNPDAPDAPEAPQDNGLVIGIVVASVGGVAIIAVAVFIILKKKKIF